MSSGNDIDFDELDRAVSSLIGSANTSAQSQSAQKQSTPATPTNEDPGLLKTDASTPEPTKDTRPAHNPAVPEERKPQKPAFTVPPEAALPPAKEVLPTTMLQPDAGPASISPAATLVPAPPAPAIVPEITAKSASIQAPQHTNPPAVRRGGRFMDVVHPSSDMGMSVSGTSSGSSTPSTPSLRYPAPLSSRPATPEIAPAMRPAVSVTPKPVPAISPTEAAKTTEIPAETRWSDSLNFLNRRKKQDVPKPQPRPETVAATDPRADQLLSPFLTDAKVEKRPLNAFMGPSIPQDEQPQPSVKTEPESEVAQPKLSSDDPQRPASALPPEFGEDLVAIEAGEPKGAMDRPDTPPALPPENNHSAMQPPAPKSSDSPSVRQALSAAATLSIPQQYKTKPVDEASAPHSMFDVEEFKHPLLPAGKKKKGPLFWFVMIFLLLLVGAGVGVGAYYLTGGFN